MPAPIDPQVIYSIRRPESKLLLLYFLRSLVSLYILFPLMFVPLWIRYATMSYRFDDQGIRKTYGLFFRHEDLVQYGRIQDLHLSRGLLERWLGLGTIQVQTASGSGAAEMTIEGLSIYDQLRDFLYLKMRGARFGDDDPNAPAGHAPADDVLAILTEIREEIRLLRSGRRA
jgi:putative membrane protein